MRKNKNYSLLICITLSFLLSQCGKPKKAEEIDTKLKSTLHNDEFSGDFNANLSLISLKGKIKEATGTRYKGWGILVRNKNDTYKFKYIPLSSKDNASFDAQVIADVLNGYTLFLVDSKLKIIARLVDGETGEENPAHIVEKPPTLLNLSIAGPYLKILTDGVKTRRTAETQTSLKDFTKSLENEYSYDTNLNQKTMISYVK